MVAHTSSSTLIIPGGFCKEWSESINWSVNIYCNKFLNWWKSSFSLGFCYCDAVTALPTYFQWGRTQSCCWSTQWASTWCLPGHTLPEMREEKSSREKWWKYVLQRWIRDTHRHIWTKLYRDKDDKFCCSYLLSLQSQFNKDLLQFLIDKVDTKLLKSISLLGHKTFEFRLSPP